MNVFHFYWHLLKDLKIISLQELLMLLVSFILVMSLNVFTLYLGVFR